MAVILDAKSLAKQITVEVKIKGYQQWAWRVQIAAWLIRLVAWVMWAEVRIDDEE